jgi:hypothetical protein
MNLFSRISSIFYDIILGERNITMKGFIFVLVLIFTSTSFLQAYEYHWSEVLEFPWGCSVENFLREEGDGVMHESRYLDKGADTYIREHNSGYIQFDFNKNNQLYQIFYLFEETPDQLTYMYVTGRHRMLFGDPSVMNYDGLQIVLYNTDEYFIDITATATGWSIRVVNKKYRE